MAFDAALDEIVLGTGAHGLQGDLLVVEARNHDDRFGRRAAECALERGQTLAVGESQVEEHDIHTGRAQLLEGQLEPIYLEQLEGLPLDLAQHLENQAGVPRIVLDEEDPDRTLACSGGGRHDAALLWCGSTPPPVSPFLNVYVQHDARRGSRQIPEAASGAYAPRWRPPGVSRSNTSRTVRASVSGVNGFWT